MTTSGQLSGSCYQALQNIDHGQRGEESYLLQEVQIGVFYTPADRADRIQLKRKQYPLVSEEKLVLFFCVSRTDTWKDKFYFER